jgi:hypothetical protein
MQDAIRSYYKLKLECYGVYTTVFSHHPLFFGASHIYFQATVFAKI